ncbi:hypothetical protein HWI79_331 [Cryptosporidium felis]|nr:hypothetical protein HWI79_331 [Cryptosporidium felis]
MEEEGHEVFNRAELECPMNLEDGVNGGQSEEQEILVKGQNVEQGEASIMKEEDKVEKPQTRVDSHEGVVVDISGTVGRELVENKEEVQMKDEETVDKENDGGLDRTGGNNNQNAKQKHLSKIDFSVFEYSFFRRYKSFFRDKLTEKIDLSQDKISISKKINEHFSSFEINPVDVIRTFLVLRKNSEHSHGHFVMSPAQSPEPNIHSTSETNTRGRRCTTKDMVNAETNNADSNMGSGNGANSFKGEYKSENSSMVENNTEIGVSTRNSRKGRVSSRGRR